MSLSCDICDLEFGSNDGLISHMLLLHKGQQLKIRGTTAKVAFLSFESHHKNIDNKMLEKDLDVSKEVTLQDGKPAKKTHKCHCQRVYQSRGALVNHIRVHHLGVKREYRKCNHCGMGFKMQAELTSHIKKEHGGKGNFL